MATKPDRSKATEPSKTVISASDAADTLDTLLNRVAFGREQITITRGKNRTPVAKLVPLDVTS